MSSTQNDTKSQRKRNSENSNPSGLKIFICSTIIATCMMVMCLSVLMPDLIQFAKPYAVAIFSFMCLFNTIMFLIFDE